MLFAGLLAALLLAAPARAHFIWIHLDPAGAATARIQFSEGVFDATPPMFLKPLEGLALRGPDGLAVKFDGSGSVALDAAQPWLATEHVWGLMGGGDARNLLVYHSKGARTLEDAAARTGLRAELFARSVAGGGIVLSAMFEDRPAVGAQVTLLDREGHDPLVLETDERGEIQVPPLRSGLLQARALIVEPLGGEYEGEAFVEIRHYATLLVAGAPSVAAPAGVDTFAHQWVQRVEGLLPCLPSWAEAVQGELRVTSATGAPLNGTYRFDANGGVQLELDGASDALLGLLTADLALEGLSAFQRADAHPFRVAQAVGLAAPTPAGSQRGTRLVAGDGQATLRVEDGHLFGWSASVGEERWTVDRLLGADPSAAAGAVIERFSTSGLWLSTVVQNDRHRDLDGFIALYERELIARTPAGRNRILYRLTTRELVRSEGS